MPKVYEVTKIQIVEVSQNLRSYCQNKKQNQFSINSFLPPPLREKLVNRQTPLVPLPSFQKKRIYLQNKFSGLKSKLIKDRSLK